MKLLQKNSQDTRFILFVALLQGLALLAVQQWMDHLKTPQQYLSVIWTLYAVLITAPLSLMMLVKQPRKKVLKLVVVFSLLVAGTAYYLGWVSDVGKIVDVDGQKLTFGSVYIFGLSTAWFISLAFFEHYCQHGKWATHYATLFQASWRNLAKGATATVFLGLFWLLLILLSTLLNILDLKFFMYLISSFYFMYPVTALVLGLGLALYDTTVGAKFDSHSSDLQVIGWLLPLASFILIAFVLILPFKGLGVLWDTGHASYIILGLMGFMVFLLNAAFQDGRKPEYPDWVLRLASLASLTMPIYAALLAYASFLRVQQYGLTVWRVWLSCVVAVVAIYALGYAKAGLASLARDKAWMPAIKTTNVLAASVVLALLLLLNTPLVSPLRLAVISQVAEIMRSNPDEVQSYEIDDLRFRAGRYGWEAVKKMSQDNANPELQKLAQSTLAKKSRYDDTSSQEAAVEVSVEDLKARLKVYPASAKVPLEFYTVLLSDFKHHEIKLYCLSSKKEEQVPCELLVQDLNKDKKPELIVYQSNEAPVVYANGHDAWYYYRLGFMVSDGSYNPEAIHSLAGGYKLVDSPWQRLNIEGVDYEIHNTN